MAPVRSSGLILQKRAQGFTPGPLSKGMVTSIALGAFFLVVFIVGLGVFLYCYIRASRIPQTAQLPPGSESASRVWFEKGASTPSSTPSSSPALPSSEAPTAMSNAEQISTSPFPRSSASPPTLRLSLPEPAITRPPRSNTKLSSHRRMSTASSLDDADVPPTPGTEFV